MLLLTYEKRILDSNVSICSVPIWCIYGNKYKIRVYIVILEPLHWHRLAPSGTIWHRLAPSGTVWHRLAPSCTVWNRLAPSGAVWHRLAPSFTVWHRLELLARNTHIERAILLLTYEKRIFDSNVPICTVPIWCIYGNKFKIRPYIVILEPLHLQVWT